MTEGVSKYNPESEKPSEFMGDWVSDLAVEEDEWDLERLELIKKDLPKQEETLARMQAKPDKTESEIDYIQRLALVVEKNKKILETRNFED